MAAVVPTGVVARVVEGVGPATVAAAVVVGVVRCQSAVVERCPRYAARPWGCLGDLERL